MSASSELDLWEGNPALSEREERFSDSDRYDPDRDEKRVPSPRQRAEMARIFEETIALFES